MTIHARGYLAVSMTPALASMLRPALFLGVFSIAGTGLIGLAHHQTQQRIVDNERAALLRGLNELVPPSWYDNDILADAIHVTAPLMLGTEEPVTVYRAKKQQRNIAVVINPVAPDGYNGNIHLLVAIQENGNLVGVRAVSHKETPGLGDSIEASRSDWIRQFAGLSLDNPKTVDWAVKREGGVFDQFTGATITPRAVVNAVKKALVFFHENKRNLFEKTP